MPVKITPGTNPLAYLGRREDGWRLQRVTAQDGLNPTQVVRYFEAPEGIDFSEATAQPFKLDATANADDGSNTANVTTDDRRYVVNPQVLKHQFDGLWTGGPVRWGTDQQTQKRTVEQTLTRTWPAGHGYLVDDNGNYVVVWKDATGAGFHRDGPNGTQIAVPSTDVCEYATAKAALMSHRPSLTSRFSPYMALREDIPGAYWREIVWRDFTHESIPFIEALKDSPTDVKAIVEYHFGSRVAGDVQDLTTNVDKETNTVYVKCSLLLRDLAEPTTPAELVALPCIEAPCTRETLRIFGWNQFDDGEGYKFTHIYRWPGLKDSSTTRALLEWVTDSTVLPLLRATDYAADAPTLLTSADGTGRFYTEQVQGGTTQNPVKCRVPWWRIALQKLDEDKTEDGALAFTLVVTKPEWHGSELKPHVVAAVDSPAFGTVTRKVVPSVPRSDAERVMGTVAAATYESLSGKRQSEDADGRSDVSYEKRTLYDYLNTQSGTPPVPDGHTPAGVVLAPSGNIFNAPEYDYDPEKKIYRLGWTYVEPSKLDALIEKACGQLGGNPQVRTQYHEGGYFTLRITGRSKEPKHVEEWLVAADWFKHETLEIWQGVTVELDSTTGLPTGFYKAYRKNADGSYALDEHGNLIPVGGLTPFYEIRGDLDANWMCSDPQVPAVTGERSVPTVFATIGKDTGGDGGAQDTGKKLIAGASGDDTTHNHADKHGSGWSSGTWTDPDGASDEADKKRGHSLCRVSPHVNDDGTYDIEIRRVYPHQRYWEWTTEQGSSSGDTREAKHFAYRNWPSRKAVEDDILEKIQDQIEGDWDDGWTLTGNISVNEFGLVDAPNLTLAPSWANDDHLLAKGGTDYTIMTIPTLEKSYTAPAQYATNLQPPADGYWWRIVTKTVVTGTTWIESRAIDAMQHACEGSRGVEFVPSNGHQMRHWKWHCVTSISPGAWQNRALTENDLNSGTIKHHVGDYPPTTP